MIPIIFLPPKPSQTFIRPNGDINTSDWTALGGGTFFSKIDESVLDDSDYISSIGATNVCPSTEIFDCEISLSAPIPNPLPSWTGQILTIRHRDVKIEVADTGTINLIVELKQGGTVIATRTYNNISTTITTRSFTLTNSEYDDITDHTDLRLRFESEGCVNIGDGSVSTRVYWAEGQYS